MIGEQYNDWTVQCFHSREKGLNYWTCRCVCGKEKNIIQGNLKTGRSKNCGCKRKKTIKDKCTNTLEKIKKRLISMKKPGCWEFKGCLDDKGYGIIRIRGKRIFAHRAAWLVFFGDPKDLCVCHKCDVPRCVNPDHLFLGTHKDNAEDRTVKGRSAHSEKNGSAKLNCEDVLFIRKHKTEYTQKQMANMFSVSDVCISKILSRKTWKYL